MPEKRQPGKLAVILHADIAGSTTLVQQDEHLAHERIQDTFRQFSDFIAQYQGQVREFRGDALLAEFERASDAVSATLAFQASQVEYISQLNDNILPKVRVGIAMGEVVIADNTVTGEGVVLAQRVEQLAEPGGVCITAAIHEALPKRMPFDQASLGEQELKGFDEPVRVYGVGLKPGESIPPPAGPPEPPPLALPDKPSVAVLAFDNMSGDPEQEYLSDGISENIITGLSHLPEIFVIARQSSFSYKGTDVKVQQVAQELGVQYILEGSVQRSGDRVRVTAQLIDATTGRHLWAERYDRQWEDIFALQDDITQHIVANISSFEGPMEKATRERVKQKAPADLRAYDYILLGRALFFRVTKEDNIKARELFHKAVELDPNYSLGHTWLAWAYGVDDSFGWSDDPALSRNLALEHARKAVELDNANIEAHWVLGWVLAFSGKQPQAALAEYGQVLSLNPNNADFLAQYGWTLPLLGRAEEGIESIEKAMRLNPIHPDWYRDALMSALYIAKRYQKAIAVGETINVRHMRTHLVLAGSYAQLGQLDDAHESAAKVLEIKPDFSLRWWRERENFARPEDKEHYFDGLRKAGLPEYQC
jgi:adenylate cyclase